LDGRVAWHDAPMTEQAERYDRIAAGYARWWAPVLAPAVASLLDRVDRLGPPGSQRLIDIGTGTGQLALGALARWPKVTLVAVDASAGMREMADANADHQLSRRDRQRFESAVAFADRLPYEEGSFDLALSSFVYQLVPNRARALREARRVLRPAGTLAYVSWLQDDRAFEPDMVFDDILDDLGIGAREGDGRSGDLPSVERTAGELRRAGFAGVTAEAGVLEHRFSVEGYIAFLSEFDEETLFAELEPDLRARLHAELRLRLGRLSGRQMTLRFPIVFASGRRSGA
jgi:ubiquinone/menaquinone biosynthesis C-methylase UbiE